MSLPYGGPPPGSTPDRVRVPALVALLASLLLPPSGVAQDVELLGEIHGTRPPEGYWETLREDPNAFRFSHEVEGLDRVRLLRESPRLRSLGGSAPFGASALAIGPRDGPLEGTFRFPLVLGLFADGPGAPPFPVGVIQAEFFDGPNSRALTIPELYGEMSRGLLNMEGVALDWVQTGLTRDQVTLGNSGFTPHPTHGMSGYIEAIVQALDSQGVDWSQFDMSGDGYVDVLAVMHPYRGAECSAGATDLIWSHRWSLERATTGPGNRFSRLVTGKARDGFETSTPYAGGGYIHVNDYIVQPLLDCSSSLPPTPNPVINRIGVFAHELGHAFGLPDLYPAVRPPPGWAGVGNWDLMGTGAWGCSGVDAARPCHFGAWTKSVLGWVDPEEVGPDEARSVLLEPVQLSGRVLRIDASDGSGEYLLLENRQRLGSDLDLPEPGLLVWHVDPTVLDPRWPQNAVNVERSRMGLRLVEADGRGNLTASTATANRGDSGDPFPGCFRESPFSPCTGSNPAFHVGTHPAAVTQGSGYAFGVALTGIELVGGAPHDVAFELDTRFVRDTVLIATIAEAARAQDLPLEAPGVPGSAAWRFVDGELPPGITVEPGSGRLIGATLQTGSFGFELAASDGPGREVTALVSLEVVPPELQPEELLAGWLWRSLAPNQNPIGGALVVYLDLQGNGNGGFDLGDARAHLQATGVLPPGGFAQAPPVPGDPGPVRHIPARGEALPGRSGAGRGRSAGRRGAAGVRRVQP